MDLKCIREALGITVEEWSALMGVEEKSQLQLEARKGHRQPTLIVYGLIKLNGARQIENILRLWALPGMRLRETSSQQQLEYLFKLAERFVRSRLPHWRALMREQYPNLCPPIPKREAAATQWRTDRPRRTSVQGSPAVPIAQGVQYGTSAHLG